MEFIIESLRDGLLSIFTTQFGDKPIFSILVNLLFLAIGILLIVKCGDLFVDAASWIAEASGIPKFIVGATVVSLATTLPELLTSVFASARGRVDMAIGNAVGSVTANIGLIMAISLLAMPALIKRGDYWVKIALMLGAALTIVAFGVSGKIGLPASVLLISLFAVNVWENIHSGMQPVQIGDVEMKILHPHTQRGAAAAPSPSC